MAEAHEILAWPHRRDTSAADPRRQRSTRVQRLHPTLSNTAVSGYRHNTNDPRHHLFPRTQLAGSVAKEAGFGALGTSRSHPCQWRTAHGSARRRLLHSCGMAQLSCWQTCRPCRRKHSKIRLPFVWKDNGARNQTQEMADRRGSSPNANTWIQGVRLRSPRFHDASM